MKRRQSLILIGILVACLAAAGCAANVKKEKTADQLAEEGMKAFEKKRYLKSIESFEKLRDWYPFSQYALLADLKIADANYKMKSFDEAAIAYEEFERLHPRNEAIPFVVYRIGLCHYNRLNTIDRDQAPAKNALEAFYRLQRQFPGNEYAEKATKHILECRKSLAGHELYVGKFYFKSKHYKSALNRFENVVENFADVGDIKTAQEYITLCRLHINEDEHENKDKKN